MGVLFPFIAFIILAYAPGNVKVARRAPVWYAGKNSGRRIMRGCIGGSHMKKYLSLLLACVLALALLCACGKKDAAEQTPAPETPPTQTAATGGVDTSCKLYFPNDAADDLHADTAQIPDTEPAVTTAYAQAIAEQLIAHDALPKGSQVLAISKDGDALSLDLNEAFLAGLRESGSTGELMYMGSLVNTFLDNFNCTTVRVTVNGQSFSTGHSEYDKPLQAFTF